MNVPQYRNCGTYQSIVCCHSVDVDKTDHAGIRWYELRKTPPETTWTIRQQGTYAPDVHSRWMGSIMLNGFNELGLGYSVSGSTLFPGIRYSGQTAEEYNKASGILDFPEGIIHTGFNSQTGAERWGDYAQMSVDPAGDSTFWFTSQYAGSSNRRTKIAGFQIGPFPPSGNFTADNTLPCINNSTVTFTSQATGIPTHYAWAFSPDSVTYVSGTDSTSINPKVIFNALGSYKVELTLKGTGGSTTTIKNDFISVNEANPDFTANLTNVAINDFITFTDSSACDVNSWLWDFGADALPATANTQGPHSVSYTGSGKKTISLMVNGNATETKTAFINVKISHETTAVPEYKLKGVVIYPNPAKDLFRIVVDKARYPEMQVTITNVNGDAVLSRECKGESRYFFDLSKSPQGTYFVKIKTDNEMMVSKLVIIK